MVRASIAAEKAGVRSASIVATAFLAQARLIAKGLGFSKLPVAEYPGLFAFDSEETLRSKVANAVVDQIVEALGSPVELAKPATEPEPRDIVFAGTLAQVQDHFHQKLWSDGLPVIPPTIETVEEFLRFTDRSPGEVIGTLLPESREATVWNVAVNGVMAGCRPEYMPLLLAIAEVMVDPDWRIEDAGSTPGWEPLVIVNGPIVKELDFNYETGAMRVGRQANASIGRFARLYMRNVAGLRPGTTDKGTFAFTFNVAMAENEDAVAELGWKPFSVDQGFAVGENVVTVQSVVAISPPIYVGGKAADVVQRIAEVWGEGDVAYWAHTAYKFQRWHPLLALSPSIARILAAEGWTKDDVRRHLHENVKMPAKNAEGYEYLKPGPRVPLDLKRLVEQGKIKKECLASTEQEEELLPVFMRAEWIGIVLSGDPGRNQARGYMQNHKQGPPISKLVRLPARWKELLAKARG